MTSTGHTVEFPVTQAIDFHNTLLQDPYEWNFPARKDTMYLSTIKEQDVGFNKYSFARKSRTLYTQDIIPPK